MISTNASQANGTGLREPVTTKQRIGSRNGGSSASNGAKSQRPTPASRRDLEREATTVRLLSLVRRVAHEMREHLPAHLDLDDLMSAGTLGLIDAVRRFEAGKHVKIETYARYRIRGAILDALRNLDPASRDMRKKNKRAERVFHDLAAQLGRPATDAEMAEALRMSLKQWYKTVHELQGMGLEWMRPNQMAEGRLLKDDDLPALNQPDQVEMCYRQEQRELLNQALQRASERERQVLSLYYEHDLTMKQIGDRLGIDESRVSQIHSAALSRLRNRVQSLLRPPIQPSSAA
jgi:RNA polymerase sigma factor FliA